MAESHAVEHQYHLVDPSPWPIIGAISAFVLALGFILFMHDVTYGGYVFATGGLMVLYTMFVWWRDVIRESTVYHTRIVQLGLRYGMALFISSEVMFFFAWFWAYFNAALSPTEAMGGQWPPVGIEVLDPWHLPLVNTLILLLSGATVTIGHHHLIEGDRAGLKRQLIFTVALGALFTSIQAYEYVHATFTLDGDIYGTTFYMATGFHGAHVIIGTIFLSVCLLRAYLGQFTPTQHFGLEAAAWYWHFVDVVWLFLFSCIYVWGSAGVNVH